MSRILDNQALSKRQRQKRRNRRLSILLALVVVFLIALYVIIARSGYWLVKDDPFEHVSWVAVLDGQEADMERTDYAADLLRMHKADSVIVLGRRVFRDKYNADFYAEDMMRVGDLDSSRVFVLGHNDPSTVEEAMTLIPWFKARGTDTVLIVTAAAATARASYIFNTLSGNKPYFKTVDIHHYSFNPATWASVREARKWWLRELAANIAARFDLMFVDTLQADRSKLGVYISMRDEVLQKDPELSQMNAPVKPVVKEIVVDTLVSDTAAVVDTSRKDSTQDIKDVK